MRAMRIFRVVMRTPKGGYRYSRSVHFTKEKAVEELQLSANGKRVDEFRLVRVTKRKTAGSGVGPVVSGIQMGHY